MTMRSTITGITGLDQSVALHQTFSRGATVLKMLAADERSRELFAGSPALRDFLWAAASRYVVATDQAGLLPRLAALSSKGYRTGVEYVGEDVQDPREVEGIVKEYLSLLERLDPVPRPRELQLGFDLSNVGLLVSPDLAYENVVRILEPAAAANVDVLLSMERSPRVDVILATYQELKRDHDNIGVTLQAHLHRTPGDLQAVGTPGSKLRLVKGVYREEESVAMPRGPKLDDRYVELVHQAVGQGARLACGTHDEALLERLRSERVLPMLYEIEMLHGVQSHVLRQYRQMGVPCRVATVYGENWWLHFLHRLAEYPPNVLVALADLGDPDRIDGRWRY